MPSVLVKLAEHNNSTGVGAVRNGGLMGMK